MRRRLTVEEVAHRLLWSIPKISRIEPETPGVAGGGGLLAQHEDYRRGGLERLDAGPRRQPAPVSQPRLADPRADSRTVALPCVSPTERPVLYVPTAQSQASPARAERRFPRVGYFEGNDAA